MCQFVVCVNLYDMCEFKYRHDNRSKLTVVFSCHDFLEFRKSEILMENETMEVIIILILIIV